MSFIGESRKGHNRPWELFLCLEEADCQFLLKAVKKIAIQKRKNYEKWCDIHYVGEMTSRQQTAMFKAEEKMEAAESLCDKMQSYIKMKAKIKEHYKQIMEGGDQ